MHDVGRGRIVQGAQRCYGSTRISTWIVSHDVGVDSDSPEVLVLLDDATRLAVREEEERESAPGETALMGGIFSFPGCVIFSFADVLDGSLLRTSR